MKLLSYRLFIDDRRRPPEDGGSWIQAWTSAEAIAIVRERGLPNHIAFDHDLGGEDTAMIFVYWLVDYILDTKPDLSKLTYYVHSDNPAGRINISSWMDQILRVLR